MQINGDRLCRDIEDLGSIGYRQGQGVTRLALTPEDLKGRRWLADRMKEASLEVEVDPAANVIGRLNRGKRQTVIVGSHLDTVPSGGRFDGALGVLAGLECARVLIENSADLPWNLEIINFTDEEGHHNAGTFGSRAMMGLASRQEMKVRKNPRIASLEESFRDIGLDPDAIGEARRDPAGIRAYLEMHVEQGMNLENQGVELGAVTGIVGIYRYLVLIAGEANHAGTTPMATRNDALVNAAPLFTQLPQWVAEQGSDTVGTIGHLRLEPGAMNVIPGKCEFTVELRSMRTEAMEHLRGLIEGFASGIPKSQVSEVGEKDPVWLDQELLGLLAEAARKAGASVARMPSGAGHDAMTFAPYAPTAMLFVPSLGGKSHCPDEWTSPQQVALGTQALLTALLDLADLDRE